MRRVQLIGGPHCGCRVDLDPGEQEVKTALVGSHWGFAAEVTITSLRAKNPNLRVGSYRCRGELDAALGRWTWKEPG